MKTRSILGRSLVVWSLLLSACSLLAQKEQWLEYRLDPEGSGYAYLNLSTNPPAGVPLPKCSPRAVFGKWVTPLDPAGRWFCLDWARPSGPPTQLYVDTAGNGRLDDKTPFLAKRSDNSSAYFEPVKFLFKGEDGPISYHLICRSMQFEQSRPELLLRAGASYSGLVDFAGKKCRLTLVDENVNGVFNDAAGPDGEGDYLSVQGDKTERRLLGRMLEHEDAFYQISVARDGAYVTLQKLDKVVQGKVQVPENISEIEVCGENGDFLRKPVKGEFSLPIGHYRVLSWSIERKDSKGIKWTMEGTRFPQTSGFEVAVSQPVSLAIGEPARAVLHSYDQPQQEVRFALEFRGRSDESVRFTRAGQNPSNPKVGLVGADGVYHWTNSFEFG